MGRVAYFVCGAVIWTALCTPGQVRAQTTLQDTDAEGRAVFQAGRVAYDAGRYADALQYFQRAYELSGRSQLLYNVGQAADRMRMDEEALDAFKRYLAETPAPANRDEVETRIAILEGVIADRRAAELALPALAPTEVALASAAVATEGTAASPAATRDDTHRPITSRWWFWVGAGAIVAGIVVGVAVAAAGSDAAPAKVEGTDGRVIQTLSVAR